MNPGSSQIQAPWRHRWTPDVPMVAGSRWALNPEAPPGHPRPAPPRRLGTKRGFIAVKSQLLFTELCARHAPPARPSAWSRPLVCTYQAISGAGKTFETMPDILDNVIPLHRRRGGKRASSEPMKIWGPLSKGDNPPPRSKPASPRSASACACVRMATWPPYFVTFGKKPPVDEIKAVWAEHRGRPRSSAFPAPPKQFLKIL